MIVPPGVGPHLNVDTTTVEGSRLGRVIEWLAW